ncbi:MAG: serine/threonine-protein kinase [Anaerolineales bacterium]|nr:serine/threonine-protein kinase [Chloroflexota bacterium]MBL6981519.1 serine/threonine-protein kinase [Anaerolineales bacterium]
MTLERGTLLHNRYRILEILGQGGMGSIYRAVDDNLGVEVAVKENLFTTDEYARQFRREATILAGLRHTNLPRVSDHFVFEDQGQYLVMDYIEGEDLRERMDRIGVIPEAEALIIGVAMCDALTYMHTQNPPILHRDIKPGNVKITSEGKVFLVDFGLAKVAFRGQRTVTGARAMTPGYSPPEQYGGARTDHRSDIYSLAATLYASMAGVVPEDSLARTMEQAKLTPLRNRNPDITRRFSKVIEKALAVHPDDRYQTADEFKQSLLGSSSTSKRRFIEGGTVDPLTSDASVWDGVVQPSERMEQLTSDPSSPSPLSSSLPIQDYETPPMPKPLKKRRGCLTTILLVVLLLVVGGGVAYYLNPDLPQQIIDLLPIEVAIWAKPTETSTLEPSPTTIEPSATFTWTSTDIPPTSTILPTMTAIISATLDNTPTSTPTPAPTPTHTVTITETSIPTETNTLVPSATLTETPTITSTTELSSVATPRGGGHGQIAFASFRTGLPQIYVIDIDGTDLSQLTDAQLGACQPDWSPDGAKLVFISPCEENQELYDTSSLFIINADGSGLEQLPTTGKGDFDPAWSPDGKQIAFTSLRNAFRPQVHIIDLESKEVISLSEADNKDYQPEWSPDGSNILFVSTRNGPYQIWTMKVDGTEQLRFTASRDLWNTYPVWSPDSQMILYTQRAQGGVPRLYAARYPDGATAEFYIYPYPGAIPMREANYSPDGNWLVFESWPDGALHDIYIMRQNGNDLTQMTFDPEDDFDPDWRPVGP